MVGRRRDGPPDRGLVERERLVRDVGRPGSDGSVRARPARMSAGCSRRSMPEIAGFVGCARADQRLADSSPGFVWRLQTDAGDATAMRPTEDDLFLINMSVWSSIEALRAFTYASAHVGVLRRRRDSFERLATAHLVLWWVSGRAHPERSRKRSNVWISCAEMVRRRRRSRSGRRSNRRRPDLASDGGCRVLLAGSRRRLSAASVTRPVARAARRHRARGSRSGPSRRARPTGG